MKCVTDACPRFGRRGQACLAQQRSARRAVMRVFDRNVELLFSGSKSRSRMCCSATTKAARAPIACRPIAVPSSTWHRTSSDRPWTTSRCANSRGPPAGTMISPPASSPGRKFAPDCGAAEDARWEIGVTCGPAGRSCLLCFASQNRQYGSLPWEERT